MKSLILLCWCSLIVHTGAQNLYFPPNNNNTWETMSPATLGWCPDKVEALYDFLDNGDTKAFIILKDGKIVLEKYFDTFVQDSIWYWASAGKTLTGFAVGVAQEEGFLNINDKTSDYLGTGWTSCTPTQEAAITIRNQLTMTSGLKDNGADPYCTLATCLEYEAPAGTRWAYHNAPYTLLDEVIESATGQTLNGYLQSKVLSVTGMQGLFIKSGYNNVFYSKPRTMARFGLLLLNKGKWNNTAILSDQAYFSAMTTTSQNFNKSYGYLTWLNGEPSYMVPGLQLVIPGTMVSDAPADMYAAMGKNGQILSVVPSKNMVVVRMGNAPSSGGLVPITFNKEMWEYISDLECNSTSTDEQVVDALDITIRPRLAHAYLRFTAGDFVEFTATIWDSRGNQVMVLQSPDRADISGLAAGLYFVQVQSGAKTKMLRFVKQ